MHMKSTIYGLVAFFLLTACSKSVDDDLGESMNFMKVTLGDNEEIYTNVSARWIEGGNSLEVRGTNDGSSWVAFTVMSESSRVPAGTYALDDSSPYTIVALHNRTEHDVQFNFAATRNTLSTVDKFDLKIDKINDRVVEGTFSGKLIYVNGEVLVRSIAVKNGSFSTKIEAN